ncbi:LuxR C-terminal-related transcriptional regulator [Streptomyces alfalfae]
MTTLCLTRGHIQVIAGYARGHTRARIGRDLHLAPGTVAQRLRRAARSVGIESGDIAPQLVYYAYAHGYLDGLRPEQRWPIGALPPRQAQALAAIARGLSLEETAAEMQCSPHTIAKHRHALYALLGAHTAAHAVARAWQHGFRIRPASKDTDS